MMECTYFPVELYFEDKLVDSINSQMFNSLEERSSDGRYRFRYLDGYGTELWDIRTCTRVQIRLREEYKVFVNRCFFKGMEIKNVSHLNVKGMRLEVDFYGLDTKKTLALDRARVRKEAEEIIKSYEEFTFHLIINRDEEGQNVILLAEVSEDDLLNMVERKTDRRG